LKTVNLRSQFTGTGHDVNQWLVLLFLGIGIAAPAGCVLWFMSEAMNNQRDAAREKLSVAYRGQLQLTRDKLDAGWEKRTVELERAAAALPAPLAFERAVRTGLADAVICLNADGSVAYPAPIGKPSGGTVKSKLVESNPDWLAARSMESQGFLEGAADAYGRIAASDRDASVAALAMQARIRALVKNRKKTEAIGAILEHFTNGRLMPGVDAQGRLIAADEQLLALTLMGGNDPRYAGEAQRLHDLVADYAGLPIPGPQRLFLMDELQEMDGLHGDFPTHAGERLASQFLEVARTPSSRAVLESSGLPDVWKLSSMDGRAVALYRTATVISQMRKLIGGDAAFDVAPPSPTISSEWTSISGRFPGWRITDPSAVRALGSPAEPRSSRYLWIALAAIALVVLAAASAAQALRRQWRLARLKSDLVAAVSHELKTPLAAVRLLVETLLEDEKPEGKTREYLNMIAQENLRLSRLIGDFLTFSRLERNLRKFDIRVTDPGRVVDAVVAAAQERLQSPQCHFAVEVSPDLPPVRADEDALVTALLNLLDNAYKYSPAEKRITLRATCEDGHVVFAVKDNGIGIAQREQKRIFRRFYQVDRRLARESGGVGLGLSIVEFIVRAHGASVQVQSQPGKGSTFCVVMP
jgi:signal transduction histidine kinase